MLTANGRVVFGGHPTITPLLLHVAGELRVSQPNRIVVHQSEYFANQLTPATPELQDREFGTIVRVPSVKTDQHEDLARSMAAMRAQMTHESEPIGAFFVGGMEGVLEEWSVIEQLAPGILRIPIGSPGGAARDLVELVSPVLNPVRRSLAISQHFPVIVHDVLNLLALGATENADR